MIGNEYHTVTGLNCMQGEQRTKRRQFFRIAGEKAKKLHQASFLSERKRINPTLHGVDCAADSRFFSFPPPASITYHIWMKEIRRKGP